MNKHSHYITCPLCEDEIRAAQARIATLERACPCLWVGPCSYACTCANPVMSGGCQRCVRYGSDEQRLAHAQHLAAIAQLYKDGAL